MKSNEERSERADGAARRAHGRRRHRTTTYRRSGALVVLVATAAIGLAAFGGSGSAHVPSSGNSSGNGSGTSTTTGRRSSTTAGNGSTTAAVSGNATKLVDEWAACERSHGDADQPDPTIDAHGVINITTPAPGEGLLAGDPHEVTGTCSEYLAAARRAVAGGQPIGGWGDRARYVQYANCMRANGFPTFPYPSGIEPDGHLSTNFNGTGIDPNSPAFLNGNANQMCGKQIGAPVWWINNWGPPGDVVVSTAGVPGIPHAPLKETGAAHTAFGSRARAARRGAPLAGWPRAAGAAPHQ